MLLWVGTELRMYDNETRTKPTNKKPSIHRKGVPGPMLSRQFLKGPSFLQKVLAGTASYAYTDIREVSLLDKKVWRHGVPSKFFDCPLPLNLSAPNTKLAEFVKATFARHLGPSPSQNSNPLNALPVKRSTLRELLSLRQPSVRKQH